MQNTNSRQSCPLFSSDRTLVLLKLKITKNGTMKRFDVKVNCSLRFLSDPKYLLDN